MMIRVRLFARAKDLAGADAVSLDMPAGTTVGELRNKLATVCPALVGLLPGSALAVNADFAEDSLALPVGAEVALLPPVSGG